MSINFLCLLSILLSLQGWTDNGFVVVSDNSCMKLLASSALFSSSLIDQKKINLTSYFCDKNNWY